MEKLTGETSSIASEEVEELITNLESLLKDLKEVKELETIPLEAKKILREIKSLSDGLNSLSIFLTEFFPALQLKELLSIRNLKIDKIILQSPIVNEKEDLFGGDKLRIKGKFLHQDIGELGINLSDQIKLNDLDDSQHDNFTYDCKYVFNRAVFMIFNDF